jgi:2-phospho-L-lactate/phosphoenolpyruvate guanylyltransferase
MSASVERRYGVLVPVKPPARAKSRLAPLGDGAREDLATAFALDTVAAALECRSVACVLAVTDDYVLAGGLSDLGAQVLPDGVAGDLNGALEQAAAELDRRQPGLRVAALCADLPSLRPDELARVLDAAAPHPMAFLADADGVGTTLVTAADTGSFRPAFGVRSRREHLAAGAHEIELSHVSSVRRDVDTPSDLAVAVSLGVGPRTALVITGLSVPAGPRPPTRQATVSEYDPQSRSTLP